MEISNKSDQDPFQIIEKRLKEAELRKKNHHEEQNDIAEQQDTIEIDDNENRLLLLDVIEIKSYNVDIPSLKIPLFTLTKKTVTTETKFQTNNTIVTIMPGPKGQATVNDKDIWIYCISKLSRMRYGDRPIPRTVQFKLSDFLKTVNRDISGRSHERAKDALDRLDGTRVKIEQLSGEERKTVKFGLIEGWAVVENKNGRMVNIEVTLPNWLIESIQEYKIRKISPDYFNLSKPLHRRIYEIACTSCNKNAKWEFKLETLKNRCGSSADNYEFRRTITDLAKTNHLPDYEVTYDRSTDIVTFLNRNIKSKKLSSDDKPTLF